VCVRRNDNVKVPPAETAQSPRRKEETRRTGEKRAFNRRRRRPRESGDFDVRSRANIRHRRYRVVHTMYYYYYT